LLAQHVKADARVAIVGAGNGDDLPLRRLARRAARVDLIDLDAAALRRARRRVRFAHHVHTVREDVTAGAVDAILAEVSFLQLYESQSLAWEVQAYLEERGYRLFGLYDLTHGRNGMLAWGDALFVSAGVVAKLQPKAEAAAR